MSETPSTFKPVDAAVDQLIEALHEAEAEGRALRFVQDWVTGSDVNGASGHEYTGFNTIRCALARALKGYKSNIWLTAKQCKSLKGRVKDGEWGNSTILLRPKRFEKVDPDTGEKRWVTTGFLYFRAYNLDQCEGLEKVDFSKYVPTAAGAGTVDDFERCIEQHDIVIEHGGDVACFVPAQDVIRLPEREKFTSTEGYYLTKGHEVIHWTGHESRLARFPKGCTFDRKEYAADELVAELGGYALCVNFGIGASEENAVAYLQSWYKVFKNDGASALVSAATKANAAVNFIIGAAA